MQNRVPFSTSGKGMQVMPRGQVPGALTTHQLQDELHGMGPPSPWKQSRKMEGRGPAGQQDVSRALWVLHPQPRGRGRREPGPAWGATQRCPVWEGLEAEKAGAVAGQAGRPWALERLCRVSKVLSELPETGQPVTAPALNTLSRPRHAAAHLLPQKHRPSQGAEAAGEPLSLGAAQQSQPQGPLPSTDVSWWETLETQLGEPVSHREGEPHICSHETCELLTAAPRTGGGRVSHRGACPPTRTATPSPGPQATLHAARWQVARDT